MRNLISFLSRYSNLIIFLFLEAISVWFMVEAGGYQSSRFVGGVRNTTLYLERKIGGVKEYMGLRHQNRVLAEENLNLKRQLERYNSFFQPGIPAIIPLSDSMVYSYISARVVNNSVNKQRNFFTLGKGSRDGVKPEMAVVGPDGVAGIVVSVSENFSYVMSLLNLDFRMSVRLRKNGYFGNLRWDGHEVTKALLTEIPCHVDISVGDTVETSGFSSIFPPGIMVGTIGGYDDSQGDFYIITIDLSMDFRKPAYLYIIGNPLRKEQTQLEQEETTYE